MPLVRRLADGDALASRGSAAQEWCGVARGAVRISSVSLSGKQVTLTYAEPGTWFGDIALFDGLPRTHDADAHGATTLLVVRKPDFKELLAQHVELYDALLRLNCRRLRLMFDQFEDLNTRPLQARLAKQILLLARSYGIDAGRGDPHRPGAGAGRPGAVAGRVAPARQPGAQGLRARGCGAGGADAAGRAVAREAAGHRRAMRLPMEHYTGTKPVASSHAFDTAALEATSERELPGFDGPLTVEQFKGGQSNPTYKLSTPARAYVMRSKPGPAAKLLPSAHAVDREFRVMKALAGSGVPVAQMHLLCTDEAVIGRAFYVMEFMDGRVLWDQALPGMTPAERGAIYDEMNRVIAALHSVDVAGRGPGRLRQARQLLRTPDRPLEQAVPGVDHRAHRGDGPADRVAAGAHSARRARRSAGPRSCTATSGSTTWSSTRPSRASSPCSTGNCPRWATRWPTSATTAWPGTSEPGTFRGIGGLDHAALGIPSEREYVRRYCERVGQRTGRTLDPDAVMADWNFYLAYNLFRLASITQGIARRVVDGTAASAQARATGAATRPLAQMAWQICPGLALTAHPKETDMDFSYSPRTQELQARLSAFMAEHVYPAEPRWFDEIEANTRAGKRWTPLQVIEELKPKARAAGLVEPVPAAARRERQAPTRAASAPA